MQAVSADLDSTTGTDIDTGTDTILHKGGFSEWGIASTDERMLLFVEPLVFTIETTSAGEIFTPQVNDDANNNFIINFGETRDNGTKNEPHTYDTAGEYTVKITVKMPSAMTFTDETRLTSVQSGFLENTALSMASYFSGCTKLKTIPGNLFAKSTAATTLSTIFANCSSLTGIPADLFKTNTEVITFRSTFNGCTSIESALPTLWLSHETATHTNTFTGCANATNIGTARTLDGRHTNCYNYSDIGIITP